MYDLLLRNVRPMAGEACDILIKGGKIAGCGSFAPEAGTAVEDGQGAIVVPGLIAMMWVGTAFAALYHAVDLEDQARLDQNGTVSMAPA